jgi:hypothetical protein
MIEVRTRKRSKTERSPYQDNFSEEDWHFWYSWGLDFKQIRNTSFDFHLYMNREHTPLECLAPDTIRNYRSTLRLAGIRMAHPTIGEM